MPFRTGHDKKSVPVHPPLYHTPATEPEPSALHTAHPNYVYPPDPLAPLAPPQWESSSGDARLAQLYPYGIYHDAGRDNFERGVRFCEIHPWVNFARLVCNEDLEKVRTHSIGAWTLTKPSQFTGEVTRNRNGTIEVKTSFSPSVDKTLVSSLPVLFGLYSPRQGAKGVYFEVEIQRLRKDAVVAVGFGCLPYPTDFRLPGWHRHSAAVHSDDGFKFFENPDGGVPFSNPLHEGDVLGAGIYHPTVNSAGNIFYTINGQRVPTDAFSGAFFPRENFDVFAMVGISGAVKIYVNFGAQSRFKWHEGNEWCWKVGEQEFGSMKT